MTKKLLLLLMLALIASPMLFAQATGQTAGATSANFNWAVPIAAGFSMAIASGLCALAQGKAVAAAAEGTARNPGATAAIRFALIFGLIFMESLALYTFVIIFIKVV